MTLGSTQTLTNEFPRGKGGRCVGLSYHHHMPTVYKFWEPQHPEALRDCSGMYRIALPLLFNISLPTPLHCPGVLYVQSIVRCLHDLTTTVYRVAI